MTISGLAPVACLACRSKHAKCDTLQPCTRCRNDGDECLFTPSNRGHRRKKRKRSEDLNLHEPASENAPLGAYDAYCSLPLLHPAITTAAFDGTVRPSSTALSEKEGELYTLHADDDVLKCYFKSFHHSHPILISPHSHPRVSWPPILHSVVCFIASRFMNNVTDPQTHKTVIEASLVNDRGKSVELVQALLLYVIALHATGDSTAALMRLDQAIALGLELGINSEQQIQELSGREPLLAESYRRTWWELHITDTMLAALHQHQNFRTKSVPITTGLPCEDLMFLGGDCNPELVLNSEDLRDRTLMLPDASFSSFAYRIEATQILARVLENTLDADQQRREDIAQGLDARLSSWVDNLPPEKLETVDTNGKVDEMMLQARMIVYCSSIYLHLPKSSLTQSSSPSPSMHDNHCARRAPQSAPLETGHFHAVKSMMAAKNLSVLASLDANVKNRTPFFICSLVLSAVVHISAYSVNACRCLDPHKDRISQSIGLLKSLSRTWPLADTVMQQVRTTAAEVLHVGVKEIYLPTPEDSGLDDGNSYMNAFAWILNG